MANLLACGFSIVINCKRVEKIVIIVMCVKNTHCVSGRYSRIQQRERARSVAICRYIVTSLWSVTYKYFPCMCILYAPYNRSARVLSFYHGAIVFSGPWPPYCRGFTITLRHTTLSRNPLGEWSARRRNLYLTTRDFNKRQTPCTLRDSNP
jgi:hypothetical protein